MQNIKKGDIVQILKGKDRGKKGKVITVFTAAGKALVEGCNIAKKHSRQTRQDQKGGIINIEVPIALANLGCVCKACDKPTRVGFKIAKDGTKERICKHCGGAL
ncbi:MAG: 50S ribosomal protein L24 [Candidatus Omnitrophota bacterium]